MENHNEEFDVEKINSQKSCKDGCIFCLMKCPKCGTVKVKVQYQRQYFANGDVQSMAFIACECGQTVIEKIEMPKIFNKDGEKQYANKVKQELYPSPELTKQIDAFYQDYHPMKPSDVRVMYILKNDTEDYLEFNFEYIDEGVRFNKPLPSSICFECERVDDNNFNVKVHGIHLEEAA